MAPRYADILKSILAAHSRLRPANGHIELSAVFDDERRTYAIVDYGWDAGQRVHDLLFLARVAGDQLMIEYDGLHHGLTAELVQAGIPEDCIVHAWMRPCPPEAQPQSSRRTPDPKPAARVSA